MSENNLSIVSIEADKVLRTTSSMGRPHHVAKKSFPATREIGKWNRTPCEIGANPRALCGAKYN